MAFSGLINPKKERRVSCRGCPLLLTDHKKDEYLLGETIQINFAYKCSLGYTVCIRKEDKSPNGFRCRLGQVTMNGVRFIPKVL